ncbi:Retrovirus-related Pol polyprotein from transposon TNT 1-94 [Araneus ventricosus]|uniref:Retrovirus-related Pol polyprotein from transposon TNT 1-94 n=1 Tax=Araneus ventricosus TaxID=182803 RepID=A0A4Y2Q8K9_ARAVE|nr:Retrovirus-related Pol polyprotein from transposon TNT 1-94 [Araneus ventricosus]
MVYGMNFKPNDTLTDCKVCIQGKQTATPFSKEPKNRSSQLLSVIHSDLCGPMRVESIGRSFYFATFIDDCSRFVQVYFLRSKDEVKSAFLEFKAYIENKLNCKIKTLRTDKGLEYVGPNFDHYLVKNGIKRERTCAYTPQMNGIAERENRTLVNMARCLLFQSGLPVKFWAEAINCAVYIRNRCPTRGLQDLNQTPFQKLFGKKPTVKHFQTFGQKAFALNKQPQKGKFDARSTECIFIGYSDENRVYRLFDSQANKVITSRDVKFINEFENTSNYEELFFPEIIPKEKVHLPQKDKILSSDIMDSESKGTIQSETQEETHPPANDQITDYPYIGVGSSPKESKDSDIIKTDCTINVDAPRARGRPTKIFTGKPGRPRKQYNIKEKIEEAQIALEDDIPSLKEALNGPNSEEWLEAMQTEYNALLKNKAWKLVKRPKDKNIIGSKWVLRTKYNADGSIALRKARLVAKGFAQIPDVDYQETFAPVARPGSIRTVIAYCAENNLEIFQLDFIMAYINSDLDEEIFMEQADHTHFIDQKHPDYVYKLQRSLYGLKQAGRQWFCKLDEKLKSFGLNPLYSDNCVYKLKNSKGELIVIIYVDDLICCTTNVNLYLEFKNFLSNGFAIKDLGKLSFCLGIEFSQNVKNGQITMSQSKYIENVLEKFNMQDAKTVKTPLDPSVKLTKEMCPKTEAEKAEMSLYPYRSLIGSLMYLAICTRPDICHTVSYLSQFNENAGMPHWTAAKRVLKYLKGTKNRGLTFRPTKKPLVGYADADWASDITDRKSYSGCVLKFADGAISWESKKQHCVALSSTEAEYIALSECAKEIVYLRRFLNELYESVDETPTVLFSDSQAAQKLVQNPIFHSRTKHIDIRCHYIREVYERGEIKIHYIPTDKMAADILTKTLTFQKHDNCCKLIGVNVINV